MVGDKDSKLFFDRHHEFNSIESQGSPPAHGGLQLMIPDDLSENARIEEEARELIKKRPYGAWLFC
jgi:hypothetical protein